MSGFTAQEALDAQGTEDAEMINWRTVTHICAEHGLDYMDFAMELWPDKRPDAVGAGDLFAWLGY